MSYIEITDLGLMTRLGVSAEEKTYPQKIFVSCRIFKDFSKVHVSDDVSDTINYSEVVAKITQVIEAGSYNLIEYVAHEVRVIIHTIEPSIMGVDIRVRKANVVKQASSVSYVFND